MIVFLVQCSYLKRVRYAISEARLTPLQRDFENVPHLLAYLEFQLPPALTDRFRLRRRVGVRRPSFGFDCTVETCTKGSLHDTKLRCKLASP